MSGQRTSSLCMTRVAPKCAAHFSWSATSSCGHSGRAGGDTFNSVGEWAVEGRHTLLDVNSGPSLIFRCTR